MEWTKLQKSPFPPTTLGQQPSHAPPTTQNQHANHTATLSPIKTQAGSNQGEAAATNGYVSSQKGETRAEFEILGGNLQRCAKLISPTNAPKPEGNLGTPPQSTGQGEPSDTRLTWCPVPHPALERGTDENPKPLSGNRTEKTKVSDVCSG